MKRETKHNVCIVTVFVLLLLASGARAQTILYAGGSNAGGTVNSVAVTVPSFMTVTGSPITDSGTLAFAFGSQSQTLVLASPCSGAGAPVFRNLCAADIPSLAESKITGLTTDLAAKEGTANKNQANGYAGLDSSGKLFSSQIPSIAITDTYVVASQAAMLALSGAETGDVAIRTDTSTTYILQGTNPATLSEWKVLATPADNVTSVAGRTGAVTLGVADVAGAESVSNKDAAGGYAGLNGSGKIAGGEITYGTTSGTAAQGNDSRLSDARTPTAHAATHASAGSDPVTIAESQVTNLATDLAAKQATGNYITALTGDGTATGPGSVAFTLAAIGAGAGSCTFCSFTVDAKGRVTAYSSGSGGATNSAGNNVIPKSNGTNIVASSASDDGTTFSMTEAFKTTVNGAVSAPGASVVGTWYTGGSATTTKPYLLIEPSGTTSTNWNTSGTGLGINAANGFAGNLMDVQTNSGGHIFRIAGNSGTPFIDVIASNGFYPAVTVLDGTINSVSSLDTNLWLKNNNGVIRWNTTGKNGGTNNSSEIGNPAASVYRFGAEGVSTTQTLRAGNGSGSDNAGGSLTIVAGLSTGLAAAGNLALQTSPSLATGSTLQTPVTRRIVVAQGKALTSGVATSLFEVALPTLKMTGGKISACTQVTDGTDMQMLCEEILYSAVNKGGTYTSSIHEMVSGATPLVTETNGEKSVSAGTLTSSWSILNGTNKITIQLNATTSITPSGTNSFVVYYQVTNNSEQAITID